MSPLAENRENSTNGHLSPKVSKKGKLRIVVHPEAREELLEFLRRANCVTRVEDDGSVTVEVPDASEEQARLEVELYIKAWQASHPDVEAHVIQ